LGVRHGDLLAGVRLWCRARGIQLVGVDVEPVDVVEQPVGVIDDAAHRRNVAVLRLHCRYAPPHATD